MAMRDLVSKAETIADCECLIEGSKKDSATHFTLRLLIDRYCYFTLIMVITINH